MKFPVTFLFLSALTFVRAEFGSSIFNDALNMIGGSLVTQYTTMVRDRITNVKTEEQMIPEAKTGLSLIHSYPAAMRYSMAISMLDLQTKSYGKKMTDPNAAPMQIAAFLKALTINMTEFEPSDPSRYLTFNDFFARKIKSRLRPVASPNDTSVLVSAADCRLNVYNSINEATDIWIKGRKFSIAGLLNNETLAQRFNRGSIAIFRLAPQDYHRFHSPVDGTVISIVDIPGKYYSVNPLAVCTELDVFTENRRVVSLLESEAFGQVAFVSIGATLVGSINFTGMKKGAYVKRGDELGYFAYGGSTVAVLFEPGRVLFDEDLVLSSLDAVETLVKVGEKVGVTL